MFKQTKFFKGLSKKAIGGLVFGLAVIAGIGLVLAFTEPISGPSGFDEPENAQDKGDWFGFGRGWSPNASGDGSTALTKTNCDNAANWYWFEDGNGDGDTMDVEDGMCVLDTETTSDSWNGAEQVTPNNLADTTADSGTASSITDDDGGWTPDAYKNHIVKVMSGTAINCWGRVKTNTADTITVYGTWLDQSFASNCGTPDNTSHFQVFDDWGLYDNSWIGDYSCEGNFPNGTVEHHSYPTSGTIALEVADCYDGKRDLLAATTSRAVMSGTATGASATTITDTALSLDTNLWTGQMVLITSGTGADSYGYIESNTANAITVTDWLAGADPDTGSGFSIIYIVPNASYTPDADIDSSNETPTGNDGPLTPEVLVNWQGTRLPTHNDFFGFCGYKDGDTQCYETSCSSDKSHGTYGMMQGRTDECLDLSNSSWEWLSEQHYYFNGARIAGDYACSSFYINFVYLGYRFRAVFRP